jgi:hypothetical protein
VTDRKPGDTWRVRVGNQVFDAVVDPHGVHRFRQNKVINDLYHAARRGGLDMNSIVGAMHADQYSVEEVRELDALLGYSHASFLELSYNSYADAIPTGARVVDIVDVREGVHEPDCLSVMNVASQLAAVDHELEGVGEDDSNEEKLARVGRMASKMNDLYAAVPALLDDHLDLVDQHQTLIAAIAKHVDIQTSTAINHTWEQKLATMLGRWRP